MSGYEKALQQLYQAPLASFLAERKQLAAELRKQGDKDGAAEIDKRRKPTLSVWAVNQLYWQARDAFDDMLAGAERLRKGDLRAGKEYQQGLAELRRRAAALLKDAGHDGNDAILRRIGTTLGAIGAVGGFDPDPAGALAADRDPPGFDAMGLTAETPDEGTRAAPREERHAAPQPVRAVKGRPASRDDERAERERLREQRLAEEAERKRAADERARRDADRKRVAADLRTSRAELRTREDDLAALKKRVLAAEEAVAKARDVTQELEGRLDAIDEAD